MLVPRVTFNEENVGVQPVVAGVRNRIGIVGEFGRGPTNFTFIEGFTDFANRYGSDTRTGSMAYQAAYDAGAREFGIIRALANDKEACGQVVLSGESNKANILNLHLYFIGEALPYYPTVPELPVLTSGTYTGTTIGRYVIYFDNVDTIGNTMDIKWKFRDLTTYPTINEATAGIDWTQVASVSVPEGYDGVITAFDLTATTGDAGTPQLIENGVSIIIGSASSTEDVFVRQGDTYTVRTNCFILSTNINPGDTVSNISPNLVNSLSGNSPLGKVSSASAYSGSDSGSYIDTVTFCLSSSIAGAVGNNYTYYTTLQEPDGEVIAQFDYPVAAAGTTQLTTTDPNAQYLVTNQTANPDDETNSAVVTPNTDADVVWDLGALAGTPILVTDVQADTPVAGTYTITFSETSRIFATGGNVYLDIQNPSGLQVSSYTQHETTSFTGGADGPSNGVLDLYTLSGIPLIRLLAVSPGAWGNGLRVTVQPLSGFQWRLTITDTEGQNFNPVIESESYVIDLTQSGATADSGDIIALQSSNLIRGIFLPQREDPVNFNSSLLQQIPQRAGVANPALAGDDTQLNNYTHPAFFGPQRMIDIPFIGGSDGPALQEDDWVRAIKLLENTRTHIILAPSVSPDLPSAQSQLISVAENSSELEGLKIAILNSSQNLTVEQAPKDTAGLDTRRGTMVAGWSTYSGQPNAPRFSLSPDALLAGTLGSTAYFVSPAARTSAGPINSIIEVDTADKNNLTSLQLLTDAKMEIITLDANLNAFYFTNGRTLSSNVAWERIVTRRTYDVIRQDLFENLQQYKSEPHTKLLRKQIASGINAYLGTMARNSRIANYRQTICDETNNLPENYTTGEVNVDVFFLPLNSADYINVRITRTTSAGLQIGEV